MMNWMKLMKKESHDKAYRPASYLVAWQSHIQSAGLVGLNIKS